MSIEQVFDGFIPMAGEPTSEPTPLAAADKGAAPLCAEWDAEQRRRDHRRAELLAVVHAAGLTEPQGHTTALWLADACDLPDGTARSLVRLSVRLRDRYPLLADALAQGRIGWQHVSAFDRAANDRVRDALVDLIPELLDLADVATFERWSRELRGIVERLDQDGGYDPARDPANNELHLTPTIDGYTHISGRLVGEVALMIRSIINAEAEWVMARHRADVDAGVDPDSLPSPGQVRAEVLAELLDRAAGVPDETGKMPQPEIVVTYDPAAQTLTDDAGNQLSLSILRFILAAGLIRPFEITGTGDPLRMGHLLRYANRHQRRALAVRDGGCIFPGCTRPAARCDAHHVDEWDDERPPDGGATDIENLALLCRHHHRVTHRPGWFMERWCDPDRPDAVVFRWRTPAGRVIYSQRHGVSWQRAG